MERTDLYKDIAERTQGDIYVGVVGPVRTGKSTFIKRFMDLLVLPGLADEHERRRVTDELPQSGAGRTIMTTQPRFVPSEAAEIKLGDIASVRVRMVDCVGYMVRGALGFEEGEVPRMVRTPWFEEEIPFEKAAEIGTSKVITEHSTIGVVMTTDGSITELTRPAYIEAEERVVSELKALGKPFVVVLNSKTPQSEDAQRLRDALKVKYDVPVLALDVLSMGKDDIHEILESILFEFPLRMVHFDLPGWVQALPDDHYLVKEILTAIKARLGTFSKVRDYGALMDAFEECEDLQPPQISGIDLGTGRVEYELEPQEGLYYKILGEECGCPIESDYQLMTLLKELVSARTEYQRVGEALGRVRENGYAIIPPELSELRLEEPEMIKRGGQYGVRLRASGPSLHLIKADISCEVSPLVGSEQQSEELVRSMLSGFESDPARIWETNLFGKPLYALINEGVSGKLTRMPVEAQEKLQQTLSRIINEGSGGLICILL